MNSLSLIDETFNTANLDSDQKNPITENFPDEIKYYQQNEIKGISFKIERYPLNSNNQKLFSQKFPSEQNNFKIISDSNKENLKSEIKDKKIHSNYEPKYNVNENVQISLNLNPIKNSEFIENENLIPKVNPFPSNIELHPKKDQKKLYKIIDINQQEKNENLENSKKDYKKQISKIADLTETEEDKNKNETDENINFINSDKDLNNLRKNFKINFSKKIIDLSYKNLRNSEIELISNYLKTDSVNCEELKISGIPLVSRSIRSLSSFFSRNYSIKYLDLSDCSIGDIGLRQLADAFYNHKNLSELNLQKNQIGDIGADMLAEMIESTQNLSKIELEYNLIGNRGAEKLLESTKMNLKIKWLNLFGNLCINPNIISKISSQLKSNRISTRNTKLKYPES